MEPLAISCQLFGGGFFSTEAALGNGTYQQLALTQSFEWNRWASCFSISFPIYLNRRLVLAEVRISALPGVGGTVAPSIPGMGNNYVPNQSIYAASGPRYSNAATVQVTYATSAPWLHYGVWVLRNTAISWILGMWIIAVQSEPLATIMSLDRRVLIGTFTALVPYHLSGTASSLSAIKSLSERSVEDSPAAWRCRHMVDPDS